MKVTVFDTKVNDDKLVIEVPKEYIGIGITVRVSFKKNRPIVERKNPKPLLVPKIDETYERIKEKTIKAVDLIDEEPEWQKK